MVDGQNWGHWRFRADNLTLVYEGDVYEIDLETINTSAAMLDWIFQIEGKAWASDQDLADLLHAFEAIFHPQGSLCGSDASKTIKDPAQYIRKRIGLPD